MSQLLPNVHWIEGQGNAYLLLDEPGLALVDTGTPGSVESIFEAIRAAGRQPAELADILITHADADHAGKAAALHAETGARIHAGPATAEFMITGKVPQHLPRLVHFFLDRLFKSPPVSADAVDTFEDGDVLPVLGGLQALATPGHTRDHFSFYHPELGLLFAGDALNTRNGRVQVTPPLITADQEAAVRSALRLLELNPAIIACGHGAPLHSHEMHDLMALATELRQR